MKTKMMWSALLAALAVLALSVVALGCGSDDDASSKSSGSGNETDAAFINDMTTHHQGAIDMAKLAQSRAEHPELRQLAEDVVGAQEGEIAVMKTIRDDMRDMGDHDDAHMDMDKHAMGMDMDMAALENAKPFDKAFIDAMVPHHRGAIAMAKELLENGEQPGLRKMADDIIRAQTKEIAQMRRWRKAWYGTASSSGDVGSHEPDHGSMDMGG
ncbi:DUF305 domain-containing protein [Paraconexibacter sp.]|uniref:DUF305 domain-containing protein n=1 Tax=Paraconexibacter sp. TaxID=2949640 RepID=UPI003563156D